MTSKKDIEVTIEIAAPPEAVYDAWADPEQLAAWFVDRAEGRAAPGETMTWIFDHFGYRQPVPIVAAERGRRFATGGGAYLLEVTLEPKGGATVLRLVNSGFDDDERGEGVDSGWRMALAQLRHWLERYPGRRRHHTLAMRPYDGDWAAIAAAYDRRATGEVLCRTRREVLVARPDLAGVIGWKAWTQGTQQMIGVDASSWGDTPVSGLDAMLDELRA